PLNRASLLYKLEEVAAGLTSMDTGIGNIMLKEDFELLGFEQSNRVALCRAQKAVYTVISGDPDLLGERSWIENTLEYMQKNGYRLAGDILTRYIGIFKTKSGERRFDEAWFPIM
ncbi:hypothetical protein LJC27_07815, partial [Christensenellaceae bacterium OttesenSCG-928-M15]|nr:hypothetical protein [Christensenellaceae bacterium OttesenSCG-928-M15]